MFAGYLKKIITLVPFYGLLLDLFTSTSHQRNDADKRKHEKWKTWSAFYKCWIIDVFARARAPKSVRRTILFISIYLLLGNISQPCWNLLKRLRLVMSKEVLERWVLRWDKSVQSSTSVLFFVFDNCNFHLHATRVRTDNRSRYLNIIVQFVIEVFNTVEVGANVLWLNVSRVQLSNWIASSYDESLEFTRSNWTKFYNRPRDMPLKYVNHGSVSNVRRTDPIILDPVMDRQTLSYVDVKFVVDGFARRFMNDTERVFAFVIVDQQVHFQFT